jgi:hypothetical protein
MSTGTATPFCPESLAPNCSTSESGTPHLLQNFALPLNFAPQTLQTMFITSYQYSVVSESRWLITDSPRQKLP